MRKILYAYYLVRFVMVAATAGFLYYDDADAVMNPNHDHDVFRKTQVAPSCLSPWKYARAAEVSLAGS